MNPTVKWPIITIISAALTLGGPLLALLATVISMGGNLEMLDAAGVSNPEALAAGVGVTLVSAAGGIILSGIGLVGFVVGLIMLLRTKRQKRTPPSVNS